MRVFAALCVVAVVGAWLVAPGVLAQGGYGISWWTVDGGGGVSESEGYSLVGTAGQPEASALQGDGYTLWGGFQIGYDAMTRVYLPLVLRNR